MILSGKDRSRKLQKKEKKTAVDLVHILSPLQIGFDKQAADGKLLLLVNFDLLRRGSKPVTEILVRGAKISGKFGPPDSLKNGPGARILRCKHFNDTSLCQSVCIVS